MGAVSKKVLAVAAGISVALIGAAMVWASAATTVPEDIELVLTDYSFDPKELTLQAGTTHEITLVNRGSVEHEFAMGRGGGASGAGGEGEFEENFFEGVDVSVEFGGGMVRAGEVEEVEVEPGQKVKLVFTVPASKRGSWQMACFVEGHYDLGMHGPVTVR